ncbi:carbon-nitrogen hydrolase family protein [Patescibacteria group bacterium]
MKKRIKVAVAQYEVPGSTKDSIKKLNQVASLAEKKEAKLLVAPETAIGMLGDVKSSGRDCLPDLQEAARKNNINIATSFYIKEKDKFYNQGYIVSNSGEVINSHRKIYLAPPEREQDGISPGKKLTVSKSRLGNLAMLICKDGFNKYSHFLYKKLGQQKTDIVCLPTWSLGMFKPSTQEYIKALFVYGAFTSRAFVLVSGNLNKETKSFGRSLIVSPIKGVLKEGSSDKEELLVQDLDLNEPKRARRFDSWWQPKKRVL